MRRGCFQAGQETDPLSVQPLGLFNERLKSLPKDQQAGQLL